MNKELDLTEFFERELLAKQIGQKIDRHCQDRFDDGHRKHLGASLIGHSCSRYLWYVFRWAHHTVHSGQLYRLFQRGHREEVYIVEYMRGIGFEVKEFQDDGKTQLRISDCEGHFGGSLDGLCKLPPEFGYDKWMLAEFKTINEKGNTKLKKEGMVKAKPQHFSQTSTYGLKYQLEYCLYVSVNKNTDELHIEIVPLDWSHGEDCLRRAESVINSKVPPEKLSQNSAYFECKYCDMIGICHHDQPLDQNCRSCVFAEPVEGGKWECSHYGIIPDDHIIKGCEGWESVQ